MTKYLLLLVQCLFLAACTLKESHTVETIEKVPLPGHEGPTDSGGGSGVDGKPLESYIQNIREFSVFKSKIQQTLLKVGKVHSRLAGDLFHIAMQRNWYFVPVNLDQIPSELIGAHFATEQLALQNYDEVWFDSKIYDKMDDSARETILVHELVMGVRLLEFQNNLDRCFAEATEDLIKPEANVDHFNEARKKCLAENTSLPGWSGHKPMSLDQDDYSNIRNLTKILTQDISTMTTDDFEGIYKILKRRN